MAMPLATLAELQAALPGVDATVGQSAIDRASAMIRAIARQQFDLVPQDTVDIEGGGRDLHLPERPVTVDDANPLTVIELDDLKKPAGELTEGVHFSRSGAKLMKRWRTQWQPGLGSYGNTPYTPYYYPGRRFGWPHGVWGPFVRVTYTHGYATPPPWLTALTVSAATVYANNPGNLYSETVGGITLTWQRGTTTGKADLAHRIEDELITLGVIRRGAYSIRSV
jgi:hypothetical protein